MAIKELKSIKFPGLDDVYVIPEGGDGDLSVDLIGSNEGEANPINADTLGGVPASEYITRDEVGDIGGGSDDISIDMNGVLEGSPSGVNADTLGGYSADHYATQVDLENSLNNINTGMSMELLWENASPTSDFAAGQSIAINAKNKLIAIESKVNKEWGQIVVNVVETYADSAILSVFIGENNTGASRTAYFYSDNITFSHGANGGNKDQNQWLVPIRIYEIKF